MTAVGTFPFERAPRALVTGGAGGIGLAVARRLRDIGGHVVIADLPVALDGRAREGAEGLRAVAMDVTDEASVHEGVRTALEALGELDTVVNAAGLCRLDRFEDVTSATWAMTLAVNLTGTFLVLREAMPALKASGVGRVVNVASDAGKRGHPWLAAYCASKFGVIGLTQSVAAEVASTGVRVNAVCPSTIADTAMGHEVARQRVALGQAADLDELARQRVARFPLGRPGSVDDVVEAILFLLSDSAAWITGESLNIDGGSLAG